MADFDWPTLEDDDWAEWYLIDESDDPFDINDLFGDFYEDDYPPLMGSDCD